MGWTYFIRIIVIPVERFGQPLHLEKLKRLYWKFLLAERNFVDFCSYGIPMRLSIYLCNYSNKDGGFVH